MRFPEIPPVLFILAVILLIGSINRIHCEGSLKVENGTVDGGYVEHAPCPEQNFCPLDSGTIGLLRKQNELLDERRALVARLVRARVWRKDVREKVAEAVVQASFYEDVDPLLALAVIKVESNYNPRATSEVGAMGLMQLMPATAKKVGTRKPYDVDEAVRGGVRYLRFLQREFPDSTKKVVAAYNAGPGAVRYFRGIPPFPETVDYVQKVMTEKRRLEREKRRYEEARAEK
jgi:hypothetical protein